MSPKLVGGPRNMRQAEASRMGTLIKITPFSFCREYDKVIVFKYSYYGCFEQKSNFCGLNMLSPSRLACAYSPCLTESTHRAGFRPSRRAKQPGTLFATLTQLSCPSPHQTCKQREHVSLSAQAAGLAPLGHAKSLPRVLLAR